MDTYVFDLGGVLINLNVTRCMHAFEALMGEANMRAVLGMDRNGEGVKAVSVASKQLMMNFEKGLISSEQFIAEILHCCLPGTTEEQIINAWMSMLDILPCERLQFVDSLRAEGHRVYLLSNGNDLHFDYINNHYQLDSHFDGFFLSHKMHMSKPNPKIFRAVHTAIRQRCTTGSENDSVIFIDDIEANRLAASQAVQWESYSSIEDFNKNRGK